MPSHESRTGKAKNFLVNIRIIRLLCLTYLKQGYFLDVGRIYGIPASMTLLPFLIPNQETIKAISAKYKIWVLCGKAMVHSSGVGLRI